MAKSHNHRITGRDDTTSLSGISIHTIGIRRKVMPGMIKPE
ncbi:MAG: hypothetical protein AAF587_34530 [Bacteroidota bacterium]